MYTKVCTEREIAKLKRSAKENVLSLLTGIESQQTHIVLHDRLHLLGWYDSFRVIVEGLECSPVYRNLIINSCFTVNSYCPLVVPVYLSLLSDLLRKTNIDTKEISRKSEHIIARRRRVSSTEVINCWKKTITDDKIWDLRDDIILAVKHAGSMGSIHVKKTSSKNASIDIQDGLKINCQLSPGFAAAVGNIASQQAPKIIVVDGAVTEVSQLHHILTDAHEKKIRVVILAAGFSADIDSTLATNWVAGKLAVVPLILESDLEDVNQIRDICEPLCIIPVSKDSGKLLSSVNLEEEKEVVSLNFSGKEDHIIASPTKEQIFSILRMRSELATKLRKEKVDDLKDILRARLSKLASRMVILNVPCTSSEEGLLQDRIGTLFDFLSTCANQSVCETKSLKSFIPSITNKNLPAFLPAAVLRLAIQRAISDSNTISNIGCIISLEPVG